MIILINHFIIFLKLLKDLMRNDEEGDVDQIIGGSTVPKWQHNYMVVTNPVWLYCAVYNYIAMAYNGIDIYLGIFEVILSQHS